MKKSKLFAALVCFMLFIVPLSACGDKLNLKNYNKIKCVTTSSAGVMTFDEVIKILGEPDNSSSEDDMEVSAKICVWGNEEKNITVTFLDNRAIAKTQKGLS